MKKPLGAVLPIIMAWLLFQARLPAHAEPNGGRRAGARPWHLATAAAAPDNTGRALGDAKCRPVSCLGYTLMQPSLVSSVALPEGVMIADVLTDAEDRMKKSIEALGRELAAIRTGHAHVGLVDHIRVDYYGTPTPVNQMATVAAPEARLLTIQPWDRSALSAIEKAIQKSDLGLTPSNDGAVIRLVIPPLTEQRRRELIKVVHARVEDSRVAVRNVRRDSLEKLRRMTHDKEISEDDQRKAQDQLQKLTDRHIALVDQRGKEKEAELMEV